MTTMMYNPNNVATEASPYTTKLEREVGEDLCEMLGYESRSGVQPWGHVTCVRGFQLLTSSVIQYNTRLIDLNN